MPVYSAWILFSIENSIMVFCTFNLFWITTGTYAKYVFRINAKKKRFVWWKKCISNILLKHNLLSLLRLSN